MFFRKKKNVSVQVIAKILSGYKMLNSIASSSDSLEVKQLVEKGRNCIKKSLASWKWILPIKGK
jgi:hypothetical protein